MEIRAPCSLLVHESRGRMGLLWVLVPLSKVLAVPGGWQFSMCVSWVSPMLLACRRLQEYYVFNTVSCIPGDTLLLFHESPCDYWGIEHRVVSLWGDTTWGMQATSQWWCPQVACTLLHAPHCGSQCPTFPRRHFFIVALQYCMKCWA